MNINVNYLNELIYLKKVFDYRLLSKFNPELNFIFNFGPKGLDSLKKVHLKEYTINVS